MSVTHQNATAGSILSRFGALNLSPAAIVLAMLPTSDTPRFQHDCDVCQFLGHYRDHDLYFCDATPAVPTVRARYGSDGMQYTSGLQLAEFDPHLTEARERAIARGLLPT